MAQQDGQDNSDESRAGLVGNTANRVVGALTEPRSFLLFIFAVLALIEYSNWTRTQALVKTVVGIIETTTGTVSREQDFNRDMMEGMLRIIEDDESRLKGPQYQPPQMRQPPPTPESLPTHEPYPDQLTPR